LSERTIYVPSDLFDRLGEKAKERNKSVDELATILLEIGLILFPAFLQMKEYLKP